MTASQFAWLFGSQWHGVLQDEENAGGAPSREGPTSFAGMHLNAGRASLGNLGRVRGSGLLSMLHTKDGKRKDVLSPLAAEVDGSGSVSEAAMHMKAIMQSKKRAIRR